MTTKLSSRWICGRLHVEGVPRGSWETDIAYYKRVARHYTLLHGEYTRDMNLCHAYKMGTKVADLAVDYGLNEPMVRKIIRKHGVEIRNARPPIPSGRNSEICKLREQGFTYELLSERYGLSIGRLREICGRADRAIKNKRRKSRHIIEPPPLDITDLTITSLEWTPEMQAAEFGQHRDTDIT